MSQQYRFEVTDRLNSAELHQVALLIERVVEEDGVRPLSDHAMLHLMSGESAADTYDERHICVWQDDVVVGYGHLDMSDPVEGPSAQMAIDASIRRTGMGGRLLDMLMAESRGQLKLWAHGARDAAGALAQSRKFTKARVLLRMQRSLKVPLPAARLAKGYTVRTFEPGVDDAEWLEVNARAFAELPDQGNWGPRQLQLRIDESWFDPDGFLLAIDPRGHIAGFHWTKIHGDGLADGHGHVPIGEIYVLAVDPSAAGHHLGKSLAILGLAYLKSKGLRDVMLYVDDENASAVAMYTELGFTKFDTDVLYLSEKVHPDRQAQHRLGRLARK